MMIPAVQAEVVAFLSQRLGTRPIETAGSFIFTGADDAVKLRKATERPLADWKARRVRRDGAAWDMTVSDPAVRGLYLGLKAVLRAPSGGLTLGEGVASDDPAAIDWVLHLGRIEEAAFAAGMVGTDTLAGASGGRQMDLIADAIVAFHRRIAPRPTPVPAGASPETMRLLTLAITRAALEAKLPQPQVMDWAAPTLARLEAVSSLLDRRAAAGLAQPGHGNLHLGNVCLWRHDWALLDARAPNPTTGIPDLGWDIAPLLVELEARVSREAANRLLSRYIARTGDISVVGLLPLLMSLRAMLFAADLSPRDPDTAYGFFRLAGLYHGAARPVVVAVGGLPGVGKTTLARALAPGLGVGPGAVVLRADEIRKRLLGMTPEEPFSPTDPDPALGRAVFATMAAQLREAGAAGHAVVADATFLDPADRTVIQEASSAAGLPFVGIWLDAPLPDLQSRLAGRAFDASDATIDTLRAANIANPGALQWQRVDASTEAGALAITRQAVAGVLADR